MLKQTAISPPSGRNFRFIPIVRAEALIPLGRHCYSPNLATQDNKPCHFHSIDEAKPEQLNGFCAYLNRGDWQVAGGMIWDRIKECGIKNAGDDEI